MLFFNFLCLFYLMVLINSHTISKNIAHEETIDDIVDSIHDLEYRREYKPKHDRLHRYYRKEEIKDAAKPKEKEEPKIKSTAAKLVPDSTEVTKLAKTVKPIPKSTKCSGFWHRFKYRGNEKKSKGLKKENEVYKRKAMPRRKSYRKKQYLQSHHDDKEFKFDDNADALKGRRNPSLQRNRHTNADKRKRDVSNFTTTVKSISTRSSSILNKFKSKSTSLFKFSPVKTYEPLHSAGTLTKTLTALTTQIDNLKKEYGLKLKTNSYSNFTTQNMIKTSPAITPSHETTTKLTTDDVDFLGTAQIEALLNDIKVKAVQMVAQQSPAITDIITNTVTETTFEVDPILTHISTPGYALSTFISIDNDSSFSKRTVNDTANALKDNDTVVIANTEPTHHISVRSINEDVFTIAQTIEDMLQKELKKVYKRVKGKMSSQLADETHEAKTTARKETEKMIKKLTHNDKKPSTTSVTKPMTTPKSRANTKKHKGSTVKQVRRTPKHSKNEKNKVHTSSASTQSTFDDYVMLTLFEQILAKTHEDNVMKMLTTLNVPLRNQDHLRLFKRTPVTLARVSLKENVQKVYDEIILPDDLFDYGSKTTNTFSISTSSGAEDSSYEGLINKISYNDYVNGYKHYLKFQREQGNQNFSNLVRYQAHRHHSVDDIGKFILNKIPQLPATRLKRFFDDDIMEDQDISTKSDDSWFKKHFYLFIDNGPPRKYHTSQTVELKSPITEFDIGSSGTENPVITPRPKNKGLAENVESYGESNKSTPDSIEDSLEQLSKTLDERKSNEFTSVMPEPVDKANFENKMEEARNNVNIPDNSIFKGFGPIGLVDKLFRGKGRRNPKHNINVNKGNSEELSDIDRKKRSTKINVQDIDNLYTSQSNTLRSTAPNVIETRNKNYGYVDVNLIPRPTAIVKLRENKQKKGKFKNFFNKFRFRKRKKHKEVKKSERTKREYRVQRFNPLKKLKEIFKVKQQDKPPQNYEVPDYEMMTSHIDTFKPVKYDKVMSVEDIKGQIPNITEDLSQFHHDEALKAAGKTTPNESPILSPAASPEIIYENPSGVNATTPSFSEFSGSPKVTQRKHPKQQTKVKNLSTFNPLQDTGSSFDMPEITYDPSTNKFETNYEATPSLDEIRSEIDSLQMKLSMPDEKPIFTTSTSLTTTESSNNFSVKKIYIPPHIQAVQVQSKTRARADPKDIKIQTKLTRIAQFPLSHFTHDRNVKINPVIERPQIYEDTNEDRSSHEKIFIDVGPVKRRKKSVNTYVTVSPSYQTSQSFSELFKAESYNKPYPDYFNDLLMWHGDLLNTDRLTSPQWENILKNLKQDAEVTTLSMTDMEKELSQMKEYLKIEYPLTSKKTTARNKPKAKPMKVKKDRTRSNVKKNIIKTIALKDNTVAKGNDIIIQGEAKYIHVIKQPEQETYKYMKAADLLNDLNKIYFKSPAIKYNIEDKIHDAKRNGDFWSDNIETSNKNSKEQDSSSVLFLDTTLLAYDDGPDFLTERPKHKKMSKNSLVSSKPHQNQASSKPVAKTNQSPVQYFSTPLPMRMNDFERFLKDNQLDVQSVTTPLIDMPRFVLNKTPSKAGTNKKGYQLKNAKPATVNKANLLAPSAFVTMNPLNVYYSTNKMTMDNNELPQLTLKYTFSNKDKNFDDKRQKRYSEIRNERFFTFEPFRKKSKAGKVKKKIKMFDKKANTLTTAPVTDLRYTVIAPPNEDDNMQKEVELTIINMNDVDQGYDTKLFRSDEKVKTDTPKHITTKAKVEPEKSVPKTTTSRATETSSYTLIQKIHNNLLYNHKAKEKVNEKAFTLSAIPQTLLNFENYIITDDISTTTFHPMINHELFNNLHAKHPPKRVRISSHSYKYDIIYNNEPRRLMKNTNHAHKYEYNRLTPSPNYNNDEIFRLPPYNSDIAEHTDVKKDMKWRTKSRRSRQVSDHNLRPIKSVFNYEELVTMAPNWREKRRLKLFSNIKGKLKTLLRKKSKKKANSTLSPTKAKISNREDTTVDATKFSTFDDHTAKREKKDDIKGGGISTIDDSFNVDYDFDIDRIVERATANSRTTKKLEAKTKDKNQKQKDEELLLSDADIPYLSPIMSEEIPIIKDNITSTSYQDFNKKTTSITTSTTTTKIVPLSTELATIKKKLKGNHQSKEEVYFEPLMYDNKVYYEPSTGTRKPSVSKQTLKSKEGQKLQTKSTETKLEKRDIQPAGRFTAKDVAALEVIVDLVKNTVNYEERDGIQDFTESYYQNHPSVVATSSSAPKPTQGSNSIQVHIAIPYNLQVEKKRSLDSFRVRRVFAAKMFSPVDLEYQVQSFDDNKQTTTTTEPENIMTPKMYLLIDANGSLAKGNFPLKPLKGNIDLSKVKVRQVTTTKAFATQKAVTTNSQNIGRVTLSKDFVAAVNKHLVQLYENLTALNESTPKHNVQVRETNMFESPKKNVNAAKTSCRRHINWETVKRYFGHDRVCNCKCKPNRTMCRACAASDAVISELIFEFENLAKYMNEHCTEIQTFFWMNPSGGKKLRDSVHKVDQTLHDYFKRVRGKCQGRTCKTFSTCIDKRSFVKQKKMPKIYIGDPLIIDLERLANDIETSSKWGICYTANLVEEGESLINTIGNCIKDVSKREKPSPTTTLATSTLLGTSTKKPIVKNIYSLDNINVNIICKPESKVAIASSTAKMFSLTPEASFITTGLNFMASPSFYDYEPGEIKYKKKKSFRNFFANKKLGKYQMNHIFTYYVTKEPDVTTPMRIFKKRQTANQIESPLVSDTGGTFWNDYLKGNSLPHELTTNSNKEPATTEPVTHTSNKNDANTSADNSNEISNLKRTTSQANDRILSTTSNPYPEKHVFQRNINTTNYSSLDTLQHNINELFKIFHNLTDLTEIENMSTQNFERTNNYTTTKRKHTKSKKTTKIFKIIKDKFHFKHKPNATKSDINIPKTTTETIPIPESKDDTESVITSDDTISTKTTTPEVASILPENTEKSTTAEITKTTTSEIPSTSKVTTDKSTTAKITTTSEPLTLKSSTKHGEVSSQTSHKVEDSSQSESTKQETASVAETSADDTIKETSDSPKVTEKPVKGNFLNKLRMATLDFFHNKAKELRKTTSIVHDNEEIRKSRSPATENNKSPKLNKNEHKKLSSNKSDVSTKVISEDTTDTNPMILIINEYDTEMEPDFSTSSSENEYFEDFNKDINTYPNKNFRSLLLSILNYEANKLNNELARIKKDGNQIESNDPVNVTEHSKRGIFKLYISTESTVQTRKNYENDYDILKTLKDLELPTPKGLDTEPKGSGLLQKIANKFGVKVVPNTQNEKVVKSHVHEATSLAAHNQDKPDHHEKTEDKSSTTHGET